jgi:hypothetical protein
MRVRETSIIIILGGALRGGIIQEYNTKIAATQTMAISSSRDNPATNATVTALPRTEAI